jgi:hypothetical protein
MAFQDSLTTREIGEIFSDEITAAGGSVSDRFDDGNRLFVRAILPAECEVKARDRVHGGVAIRATDDDIWVHPYVFRQVCQNGAIIAHATETRHLERALFQSDPEEAVVAALREAVQSCCALEAFETAAGEMRSSTESQVDLALMLMPMLSRLPAAVSSKFLASIMDRFFEGRDNSRFGLMNAVTSVARDAHDPEVRWQLETSGGGIPAEVPGRERPELHVIRASRVSVPYARMR